jgi:hypothetical protein
LRRISFMWLGRWLICSFGELMRVRRLGDRGIGFAG